MSAEPIATTEETSPEIQSSESYPGSEFNRQDVGEFSADDTEAGANIGKMLTLFFGYSLLAMIGVTLWTVWVAFRP